MRKHLIAAAALVAAGLTVQPALADDGETAIEHRKDVMNVAGAAMGAIGCFMKGDCALPNEVLVRNAKAIAFSGEAAVAAFETDTTDSMAQTTALPAIWEKWDMFEGGLNAMTEAANELAVASAEGDRSAMGPAVQKLGGTCKDCHDAFRD